MSNDNQNRMAEQSSDEASQLRQQLSNLVREVRCTIAHAARPQGLREALTQSQDILR